MKLMTKNYNNNNKGPKVTAAEVILHSRPYPLMYTMMSNVNYFANPGKRSSPAPPRWPLHCSLIDCVGESYIKPNK